MLRRSRRREWCANHGTRNGPALRMAGHSRRREWRPTPSAGVPGEVRHPAPRLCSRSYKTLVYGERLVTIPASGVGRRPSGAIFPAPGVAPHSRCRDQYKLKAPFLMPGPALYYFIMICLNHSTKISWIAMLRLGATCTTVYIYYRDVLLIPAPGVGRRPSRRWEWCAIPGAGSGAPPPAPGVARPYIAIHVADRRWW